jgi:hypothetical protein
MTEHDDRHDPGQDPGQDRVRRLLAELADPGPLPADVAARLDDRLAALVAEREAALDAPAAEVADLSAARARRRRLRTGLVAAASVAVLAIGIGTVADDLLPSGGESQSTTAADAGGDSMLREAAPDAPGPAEGSPETYQQDDQDGEAGSAATEVRRSEVRSATLDEDLARIAGRPSLQRGLVEDARGSASALAPCAVPTLAEGDAAVPVRLDGDPATLVLRAATGGTREAQIYACDNGDALLAQGTVPAP